MTIYRFQYANGIGPYFGDRFFEFINRHSVYLENYQSPKNDVLISSMITESEDFLHGFNSLFQLNNWFNEADIFAMYQEKVFCYAYEVNESDLIIYERQVLFPNDINYYNVLPLSKLISNKSIATLEKSYIYSFTP